MMLACSSADPGVDAGSQASSTGDIAGGMTTFQETTGNPTTGPSTSPTTTFESTTSDPATPDPSSATGGDDGTTAETTGVASTGSSSSTTDTATTDGETGNPGTTTTGDDTTTSESSSSTGAPDVCQDGLQNGDETAVDCGGAVCTACDLDQACLADTDCLSGSCEANVCIAGTCDDTKKNGDETDVDCGGAECQGCFEGEMCALGTDCESLVCDANLCLAAECNDGVQNGIETDVDCGGGLCLPCDNSLDCKISDDCASGVCTDNSCTPPTCSDLVQNGMETGVDCGGNNCAPCMLASLILNEVDYDNIGEDIAEFVEIYNNTGGPVDLANIRLVLVNGGTNTTYLNLSLAAGGTLMQGQYLVVGPAALMAPPEAVKVNFVAVKDSVQNGSPDGIALVDLTSMTVLDALSYEGPMTATTVTGVPGMTNLVEGMALNANVQDSNDQVRSLIRFPNGNDKNNAATDWIVSKTPTPGLPNKP